MQLYYHRTDGGAEYYSTTYTENPDGSKEGTAAGIIMRTDGDEIEIYPAAIEAQGLKLVITGAKDPKAAQIRRAKAYSDALKDLQEK